MLYAADDAFSGHLFDTAVNGCSFKTRLERLHGREYERYSLKILVIEF